MKSIINSAEPRNFLYILALSFCFVFQACSSGEILVQEQEDFYTNQSSFKKIISIEPDFLLVDQRKKIEDFVMSTEDGEENYQKLLIENAARHDIELQVFAPNTLKSGDVDYYNYLLPLKKQIMFAMSTQEVEIERRKYRGKKYKARAAKDFFSGNLEFDPEFGQLAETYGTPYFSLNGIISFKKRKIRKWIWLILFPPAGINSFLRSTSETLYYHVVVDVRRGEIVHRELRSFEDPLTKHTMEAMLYDSYNILTHEY